jgi:hypothetical protein
MKRNSIIVPTPNFIFVQALSDLPTPASSVITLLDNYTYYFTNSLDLAGNRLVCGANTTILGPSSENCVLSSTGLSATALITSIYSLPMRNITITATIALDLNGDYNGTTGTTAIDWFGVNFTDCSTVGTIRDYTNVIWNDCAFINSARCTFDGSIGSVGINTCLFDGASTLITFILASTLTIVRRFRVIYSSFVTLTGETSLDVSATATIPADAYILTYCNFSGGGTYLSGTTETSLKALFINNIGITNTSNVGHYYMQNNGTATTVGAGQQGIFRKAAGTTTVGTGNSSKWTTATINRLTYAGTIATDFIITVVGSLTTNTTNNTITVSIAENGVVIAEASVTVRCAAISIPYPFALQDVIQVQNGDYFEVWLSNDNGTNSITLSDVNVIIQKVTG